jgi:hypothetical protein
VLQITLSNQKERNTAPSWSVGLAQLQGVTMLAEIYMVRLEAAARASNEVATSSISRFVPFTNGLRSAFKGQVNRLSLVEPASKETATTAPSSAWK